MEANIKNDSSGTHGGNDEHKDKRKVTVKVDKQNHEVRSGNYTVSEFKALVGVDASKELDEVIKGTLTPLADDAIINIQGGEKFISHVRAGGSS